MTVGGTQKTDQLYRKFLFGSNYGSCVDIFAPGQRVQSAYYTDTNSYATLDGTSQATPLVSGAAAVYWNMLPDNADANQVKKTILNTCSKGKLKITESVPQSFIQQTKNCLLHIQTINPSKIILPSTSPPTPPEQKIYHDVNLDEIEKLITDMEQQNYAVSFMQNYRSSANSTHYNFIFTHMKKKKFQTFIFIAKKKVQEIRDQLSPKGFEVTFIHDLQFNKLNRFVVVLTKNKKHNYRVYMRVEPEQMSKLKANIASEGMILYSTSVILNKIQNTTLHTLLYSNETTTHARFHYDVKKATMFNKVDVLKHGYHLKHLSNYVENGRERYAVVLHKCSKPVEKYGIIFDIDPKNYKRDLTN